jgi:hypothetical protein
MIKEIGLIDVETGERGWIRYDPDVAPVDFMLWFQSKYVENRVRAYLRGPVEMAVQARKPKHDPPLIDEGVEWRMVKPTTSVWAFEVALRQMRAEIQVALEPVAEE